MSLMEGQERLTQARAHRYRIEREIGSGAMATVFLAEIETASDIFALGCMLYELLVGKPGYRLLFAKCFP
jgi:serine/threonine protein kinase